MVAHNKAHESKQSEVKSLIFDGISDLWKVENLTVTKSSSNSISLKWDYNITKIDGFDVTVEAIQPYPSLPAYVVTGHSVTVANLAPGVFYIFKVNSGVVSN